MNRYRCGYLRSPSAHFDIRYSGASSPAGACLLHNASYGDLIEELYELPFMAGLFLMNLGFMQRDKQHESAAIRFSEPQLAK